MAYERKLPASTTSRARKAASFYESHRTELESFHIDDREWIIRMMLQGWWDNGQALQDKRFTGSARSTYNFVSTKLGPFAVPTINVVPASAPRNFTIYASRVS